MGKSALVGAYPERSQRRAPPLNRIADHCAVFLDLDGTLLNFAPRPDRVAVDSGLLYLLDDLYVATAGAVAILSGRGIEDLDAMLAPLKLPLAAIHGAQRRRADGVLETCSIPAKIVWQTRMLLRVRLRRYQGILVEDKGCAFAVHHRGVLRATLPRLRSDIEALARASRGCFEVSAGEEVFELRPRACDQGAALEKFMNEAPFEGRLPIFIGDDQSAFAAMARANGMGIAVGSAAKAPWGLPDPAAVRGWLRDCLEPGH